MSNRRAKKPAEPKPSINVRDPVLASPSERLADMTRERVEALEGDKSRLQARADLLQAAVDRLAPENARLRESLETSDLLGQLSALLVALGGGVLGYASFAGNISKRLADLGFGGLISGVVLLIASKARGWSRKR